MSQGRTIDLPQVKPFAEPEELAALARDSADFAANLATVAERASAVWAKFAEANAGERKPVNADPLHAAPAFAELAQKLMANPQEMSDAMMRLWLQQTELWRRSTLKLWGMQEEPMVEPAPGDKRFKGEDWSQNAVFDYVKQSYLLTSKWIMDAVHEADDMDPRDRKKIEFLTRNFIEAMSPANFAAINPEVLRATFEQKGENLARGLENMLKDLERGKGDLLIRQTDLEAFEVGRDMASTPGKVIFQNELFQLIQYAPTTETVHAVPLLFIPPWINKFYILDLNAKKSMVRWLVAQGWTVFVVSWVNPDHRQRDETWESYMTRGALTALDKVLEETGEKKAHLVGYCIGGTMLGTTLAAMAAKKDARAASATFFTTQLDFTDAGELQVYVDEQTLKSLHEKMEDGFLPAESMASAFNSLRASDLIWGFVIQNYMLGKDPFPFDLLYWNADSTCMPGRVHHFYLDNFYHANRLAKGEMTLGGETLDLGKIALPAYHVATKEDHIAPPQSVYRGAAMLGSKDSTFVLAGSGHIAGVVNPAEGGKYQFWTRKGLHGAALEDWIKGADETPGSWWPHWDAWLAKRGGAMVAAREPGAALGVIEEAPGAYVKVRFDKR
ncbi:MAG: class I poly(R)-hydroxyalkanoic acid synthase [Rhodobacterales bacterium CG18_big_fil_WC_8_21_14_2_50_71_9]|nr:MAG: class I poly(R)-hydroxyalkanoic acid synthase [Rhodobacterales bacterium CG18_big_fil_WC_8_21_14_2_50_71_9]PJA61025.1 MAG: class I poly(R)-hydroxyalkanoic acid synthase [Rhodobacterales bacterium CG_4_9_14_3_um_filter_71_31]